MRGRERGRGQEGKGILHELDGEFLISLQHGQPVSGGGERGAANVNEAGGKKLGRVEKQSKGPQEMATCARLDTAKPPLSPPSWPLSHTPMSATSRLVARRTVEVLVLCSARAADRVYKLQNEPMRSKNTWGDKVLRGAARAIRASVRASRLGFCSIHVAMGVFTRL